MEDNKAVDKQGINFSVEEEFTEEKAKEKKKTKNSFQKLLARLLPQEPEHTEHPEDNEEVSKTHRFRQIFKNLFGTFVDLDEQKENEDTIATSEFDEPMNINYPEHQFSLIDTVMVDEQDTIVVPSEVDEVTDTVVAPEPLLSTETKEPVIETAVPHNDYIEVSDEVTPESTDTTQDYVRPQVVSNEYLPSHESKEQTEKTVYIEQNQGGGAALLGFVAAETLSRHRDAKIRKEAEHLREQVTKIDNRHEASELSIDRVVAQNREQIATLRQKREITESPTAVHVSPEKTPKNNFEVHAQPTEKKVTEQRVPTEKLRTKAEHTVVRELPEQRRQTSENLVLEQAEKAAEQDVALEAYYERMHEAKDVPTVSGGAGSSVAGSYQDATIHEASRSQQQSLQHQNQQQQKVISQTNSLYQDAAKRGVFAGIMVLVAFLFVVLVWSLL